MVSKLHIYGPTQNNSTRIRAFCPICEKKRYGLFVNYYDMCVVALDCGFSVPSEAPIRGHYGPRGGHPIYRRNFSPTKLNWNYDLWFTRVEDYMH